jgi:hypothetical protein
MADLRSVATLPDDALGEALRGLGPELAVPSATVNGVDAAARSRALIEWLQEHERRVTGLGAQDRRDTPAAGPLRQPRPATSNRVRRTRSFRRSLLLAAAAVLIVAAIVGAVGLGLPGLRIVTATPSPAGPSVSAPAGFLPSSSPRLTTSPPPSVSASPAVPGSGLGLGVQTTLADARNRSPFPLLLPTDPRLGAPDTVWIDDVGRVTMVWTRRPGLPDTIVPGVSVIASEFPGSINPDYFEKILNEGTTIEPSRVGDAAGFWISGTPHDFVYVMPNGEPAFDSRRLAGDTLAWSKGGVTYRLETGLGQDSTIAMAAGMR